MNTKDIILELRTKKGMSQEELAEKVFVTRQAVSRWENGETTPNTETLKHLSMLFDVSINTLLGSPRQLVCQCCGLPLDDSSISKEKDGSFNEDYCKWCYVDGEYIYHNLDELIEVCVENMEGEHVSSEQARSYLKEVLPQLTYWKQHQHLDAPLMLDFIFITGASGIGKSTLAGNLLKALKTVVIEQHMIPEFISRDGVEEMTGELEELTLWENLKAMAYCFHRLGYHNVILSDIDDLRTADIPLDFRGYRYLTIKLVCSDPAQLHRQMEHRPGGGLIDYDLQEKMNQKNLLRPPLINEHTIDIAGKSEEEVLHQTLSILKTAEPVTDYTYEKPPKELFYSWVFANGLR